MTCRPKRIKASNRVPRTIVATCFLATILQACSVAGPGAIRSGRMAYNEAIAETNAQQMLMVPVHNRYEESNHLLAVSSVTANVRVSSSAGIEAGFGSSDNYEGNLVPFSGGFIYEENPTISYKPVTGEAYLEQTTAPIPLSLVSRITQMMPEPRSAYVMLFSSINGIQNPAFLYRDQVLDPRFDQVVDILISLTHDHRLYWVQQDEERLSLLILAGGDSRVGELLQVLGLSALDTGAERLLIPVSTAPGSPGNDRITTTTHTLWELIEILTAAVEVPPGDEASGVATAFPRPGRAGQELAIHYSAERPESAYVSVEYRDGWFYIDQRDKVTKRYFKLLGSLWSAAMSESLDDASASPVLTVPVSR